MDGYKEEIFVEKNEDFICSVCLGYYRDPVLVNCRNGHSFCKSCIHKCSERSLTCPIDRETLKPDQFRPNIVLKNIICKVMVRCESTCIGSQCEWIGSLSDLDSHMRNICPETVIRCRYVKTVGYDFDDDVFEKLWWESEATLLEKLQQRYEDFVGIEVQGDLANFLDKLQKAIM